MALGVFAALIVWNVLFLYGSWLAPSKDRCILLAYRLCCLAGLSTLVLFYISGLYHDTLIQPRKFIPQANRALRHYNVKLVATSRGWLNAFSPLQPGEGLSLIVSSKAGSMQFREAFEEYRTEYWQEVSRNAAKHGKSQRHHTHQKIKL